ncbi:MAG: glycosyltransferase [Planctomycetota bacterium]|nr:MAG: glycosyltransferase [Planctomycetota bacterium]
MVSVSVVIPTLNEAARLPVAVSSARAAGCVEVLVADGGSTDATASLAKTLACRLIETPRGRGIQQNAAARLAAGEVLLFLHADCRLPREALQQIDEAVHRFGATAGAFRQSIDAPGHLYRALETGNALRVRLFGLAYGDQAIFVRRDLFEAVGGFPEWPLMEDVGLMQRLRRARVRPVLLDGPVVVSARRWQRCGVVRQTLRNWSLLAAYFCGVSPRTLARFYDGPGVVRPSAVER